MPAVSDALETLKAELERLGAANDGATTERTRRMLDITRDTGEFPSVLVRPTAARRVLRPGGLLVVDNATSHAGEMAPFVALVNADPLFAASFVPVGNGELLAVKAPL